MKLKPIGNNVAIVRIKNSTTTESGIVLTKSTDEVDRARVIAVGPDVEDIKENDVLLVDWNKTSMNKFDGIPIYVIKEEHVVGVFD